MLNKSRATIFFLFMTLLVLTLFSSFSRAELLPSNQSISTHSAKVSSSDFCAIDFDTIQQPVPGCCEPGGSCFEKQCCSYGHSFNYSLVGDVFRSYESPYLSVLTSVVPATYFSLEIGSLYRPPII
ncbi:hypothetical protein [Aliivibrio salmonicida]|uniref:hypothetical protein n=1 Tax=Aliivibrio salmonicida TaxID=40269 RepID=UPI003D0D0091